jgi:hypothetical protein
LQWVYTPRYGGICIGNILNVALEWTRKVIITYCTLFTMKMKWVLFFQLSCFTCWWCFIALFIHFFGFVNCIAAVDNPYRAASNCGARFISINSPTKINMNGYSQKILSAKLLRIKQLQNELTDAQFQLNVSTLVRSCHMINAEVLFFKRCNQVSFMLFMLPKNWVIILKTYSFK